MRAESDLVVSYVVAYISQKCKEYVSNRAKESAIQWKLANLNFIILDLVLTQQPKALSKGKHEDNQYEHENLDVGDNLEYDIH
jgi:short subunit fatty acids transporter